MTSTSRPAVASELRALSPADVAREWAALWPRLAGAVAYGGEDTEASLKAQLLSGHSQAWAFDDPEGREPLAGGNPGAGCEPFAVAVTAVVDYPAARLLVARYAGGRALARWVGYAAILKVIARDLGCSGIRIIGRPGWARALGGALTGVRRRAVVLDAAVD